MTKKAAKTEVEVVEVQKMDNAIALAPEEIEVEFDLDARAESVTGKKLETLADSIKRQGQLQPVVVRKLDNGKYGMVAGYSRLAAIKELNRNSKKQLPIYAVVLDLDEQAAFTVSIHENSKRNATTPVDDAYNLKKLMERFGMTVEAAAKVFGKTTQWAKDTLTFLSLGQEDQDKLASGVLTYSAAVALAKVKDPAARKDIVAKAEAEADKRYQADKAAANSKAASLRGKADKAAKKGKADKAAKLRKVADEVENKPKKKVDSGEIASAIRNSTNPAVKAAQGAATRPSATAVRAFFQNISDGPGNPKSMRKAADIMLAYLSGTEGAGEEATEAELLKLFNELEK